MEATALIRMLIINVFLVVFLARRCFGSDLSGSDLSPVTVDHRMADWIFNPQTADLIADLIANWKTSETFCQTLTSDFQDFLALALTIRQLTGLGRQTFKCDCVSKPSCLQCLADNRGVSTFKAFEKDIHDHCIYLDIRVFTGYQKESDAKISELLKNFKLSKLESMQRVEGQRKEIVELVSKMDAIANEKEQQQDDKDFHYLVIFLLLYFIFFGWIWIGRRVMVQGVIILGCLSWLEVDKYRQMHYSQMLKDEVLICAVTNLVIFVRNLVILFLKMWGPRQKKPDEQSKEAMLRLMRSGTSKIKKLIREHREKESLSFERHGLSFELPQELRWHTNVSS